MGNAKMLLQMLVAEAVGTVFLAAAAVGVGIMAEQGAGQNPLLALLIAGLAVGGALAVLASVLQPISGAHFNPAITLAHIVLKRMSLRVGGAYIAVQIAAAIAGVMLAHIVFDMDLLQTATRRQAGLDRWVGEMTVCFLFVLVVVMSMTQTPERAGYVAGVAVIVSYWFSPSMSFANPALTISRTLTDSFNGIFPADAPALLALELVGALLASWLACWLLPEGK